MKVVWSWLKEYLPDLKATPQEVAERLNLSSFEVESIERVGGDFVIDLNVLPNRSDCLGHIGIAREISALFEVDLKTPELFALPKDRFRSSSLEVLLQAKDLCRRYVGIKIDDVKVAASPAWLKKRLELAGLRSINNIVDITNYVMLEYGQPLHAFDATQVKGKILVRRAKENEKITTIDNEERKLNKNVLVIADSAKTLAIAGVKGGKDAEILDKTTSIILESANFDPVSIRLTSRSLNLLTDSAFRFERNLDPEMALIAALRATRLIIEIAGGSVSSIVDKKNFKSSVSRIHLAKQDTRSFLGIEIEPEKIEKILRSLEFSYEKENDHWIIIPPSFRQDVNETSDVLEEIVRIHGYEKVVSTLSAGKFEPPVLSRMQKAQNVVEKVLQASGFQQLLTFSFISVDDVEKFGFDKSRLIEIQNPISAEYQFMRISMLPAILRAVAENQTEDSLRLYAVEKIYQKRRTGYSEPIVLAGAVVGQLPSFPKYPEACEFYQAKGVIENLMQELGIKISFKDKTEANYARGRTAALWAKGDEVGLLGEVNPRLLKKLNIAKPVAVFEIGMEALADLMTEKKCQVVSKFPEARFDLSLVVDRSRSNKEIVETARAASPLVKKFDLFDYYEGKGIPEGKKSLAYHVVLQSFDHTLSDGEVKEARNKILEALAAIGVVLRGV